MWIYSIFVLQAQVQIAVGMAVLEEIVVIQPDGIDIRITCRVIGKFLVFIVLAHGLIHIIDEGKTDGWHDAVYLEEGLTPQFQIVETVA